MKKENKKLSVKKLRLNLESLRRLDPERDGLLKVAGGMPMSPVPHCALTINNC